MQRFAREEHWDCRNRWIDPSHAAPKHDGVVKADCLYQLLRQRATHPVKSKLDVCAPCSLSDLFHEIWTIGDHHISTARLNLVDYIGGADDVDRLDDACFSNWYDGATNRRIRGRRDH